MTQSFYSSSKHDDLKRKAKLIPWQTAAAGLLLAPGAPLGWLGLRWFQAGGSMALLEEVSAFPLLYAYLFAGTALVFTVFGYFLGRAEARLLLQHQQALLGSRTDRATGLLNAAGISEALLHTVAFVHRQPAPLSLVRISVDMGVDLSKMAPQNRREILRAISAATCLGRREEDIPGRLSGCDFVVIAPGADRVGALVVANSILTHVKQINILGNGQPLTFAACAGVATLRGQEPASLLVSRAGRALAAARRVGGHHALGDEEAAVEPVAPKPGETEPGDQALDIHLHVEQRLAYAEAGASDYAVDVDDDEFLT